MFYKNFYIENIKDEYLVFNPCGTFEDAFSSDHDAKAFIDNRLNKEFSA